MTCGNTRNNTYSQYLKASLSYDNLKQGFYIALKLSRHDQDVPEERKDNSNKKTYLIHKTYSYRITTIRAFDKTF